MITCLMLWIRAKSYMDPYYIEHTITGIKNHTTRPVEFIVVTDQTKAPQKWDVAGIEVDAYPLTRKYEKHQHAKLEMFRPDFDTANRLMLTDLDNFWLGDLDELLSYDGHFGARSTFMPQLRPQPQMSVALCSRAAADAIWAEAEGKDDRWLMENAPTGQGRGDQLFIYNALGQQFDRLEKRFPGQLDSWKWGYLANRSPDARILYAHGRPKPHDLGWKHTPPYPKAAQEMVRKSEKRFGVEIQQHRESVDA